MKNTFFLLLLSCAFVACVPKQKVRTPNPFLIEEGTRPWIIAHGGAKQLFPENTMLAFEQVLQYQVDVLEMDVCMTKDEILVTHHDLTIDRMSDGEGELIQYTYEELTEFNFGAHFEDLNGEKPYQDSLLPPAKLADVMSRFGDLYLNIELKNRDENGKRAAEKLWELIQAHSLEDRVLIASFSEVVLSHFDELTGGSVAISTSREETKDLVFTGLTAADYLYRPAAVAAQIPTKNSGVNLATSRIINACHRREMAVHYWTINDKEEMRQLIELGADGLITDRPDVMSELLAEMGF